jgi:hypothetical protein
MAMENILAYYVMTKITVVKSFIVEAAGWSFEKACLAYASDICGIRLRV